MRPGKYLSQSLPSRCVCEKHSAALRYCRCGHCKQLAPKWTELAERSFTKKVNIASVDCTVEKDTCTKQGIRGYPTIKFYKGSTEGVAYSGARDVPALAAYAEEHA